MAEYEGEWLVVVTYRDLSPKYDEQLASLAEEFGGEFDGTGLSRVGRDVYLYFPNRYAALSFIAEVGDLPDTQVYDASFDLSMALEEE